MDLLNEHVSGPETKGHCTTLEIWTTLKVRNPVNESRKNFGEVQTKVLFSTREDLFPHEKNFSLDFWVVGWVSQETSWVSDVVPGQCLLSRRVYGPSSITKVRETTRDKTKGLAHEIELDYSMEFRKTFIRPTFRIYLF